MEQRGVLLDSIARILNAGGSALLNAYDAVTAITTSVLPGEKANFRAQLKEYEKKIERLYGEIGKEVVLSEATAHLSAAAEAGIKRVAEYQEAIEKIKRRIQEIEAKERAAAAKEKSAKESVAARKAMPEPASQRVADTEKDAVTEISKDISAATESGTEETKNGAAEATETPAQELTAESAESTEQEAGIAAADTETKEAATTAEVLEAMLKDDLLKLCREKEIEADKRMTKAEIIELILGRS